jgi:GTPase SAR1 family protein
MAQLVMICTIFDVIVGPKVLCVCLDEKNYPNFKEKQQKILEKQQKILEKIIDFDSNFFIYKEPESDEFESANLIFEIPHFNGRGGTERLMISVVSDPNVDTRIFQPELESCAKKFQQDPEIWRGLYGENAKKKEISDLLNACLDGCKHVLDLHKPVKIVFFGISLVGKTSILNYLMTKKFDPDIKPTLGMALIKFVKNNFDFLIYDMSGQEIQRKRWFDQKINPSAIVFVHDCAVKGEEIQNTKLEFERIITHYFKENSSERLPKTTPVLILANKCDLDQHYSKNNLEVLLDPKRFGITYKIGIVSALSGLGIENAFKWLISSLIQSTS